jgi:hypothetical protein
MTDFHDRKTMERRHQHLARADRELGAAQHFLHPGSAKEAEMDIVHAVAAARFAAPTMRSRTIPLRPPGPLTGSLGRVARFGGMRSRLEEPEA